jgi:Asp-tRNA(Asn)/Glu-tRNA(Gln) amidotransferase A subunit family amidase
MLQVMARRDGTDMTTVDVPVPNYLDSISAPFSGARVGVVRQYFHDTLDPPVEENFESFASRLRDIGCTVGEADLEGVQDVYDRWVLIRRAEATAFHLRWLESSPELYGDDVRKLLELGRRVLAVDYVDALNARPAIIERFSDAMRHFDFLMAPATCVAAPRINQANVSIGGRDITTYSALNRLTLPFNYVGFPAVSIPSGLAGSLPLGVQIIGKLFDEAGVLSVAHAYEEKFGPHPLPPPYE